MRSHHFVLVVLFYNCEKYVCTLRSDDGSRLLAIKDPVRKHSRDNINAGDAVRQKSKRTGRSCLCRVVAKEAQEYTPKQTRMVVLDIW